MKIEQNKNPRENLEEKMNKIKTSARSARENFEVLGTQK